MDVVDFQKTKALIVARCRSFDELGEDFEQLTRDILWELQYFNIERQNTGTQFGRDFSADRKDDVTGKAQHWYFECKNLKGRVNLREISAKLIWHFRNKYLTGGFAILAPHGVSNEVRELLK